MPPWGGCPYGVSKVDDHLENISIERIFHKCQLQKKCIVKVVEGYHDGYGLTQS